MTTWRSRPLPQRADARKDSTDHRRPERKPCPQTNALTSEPKKIPQPLSAEPGTPRTRADIVRREAYDTTVYQYHINMARVLLIAPGVDSGDIGEAWVAYQWASRLSARHSVTLLTYRKRGRRSATSQLPDTRVIEWDELPLIGRAERFNSLFKPWYPDFYRKCRRWIGQALRNGDIFDVAHQPVPVAMRYPSPLVSSGLPYVLGPVGGSIASPPGFVSEDTAPWYMDLRKVDAWRLAHDPLLRRSYAEAACVLGIAPYVADALTRVGPRQFEVMSETGIVSLPTTINRRQHRLDTKLLFVGRLIRTKGARDVIRALDSVRDLLVTLDIVGDGFDRRACENLAVELRVADRVTFHGSLPRNQVDTFYQEADVFVFPSYREPGGNVPFEAMAYGLPMIVADRGGPGYVITAECGIRVTPTEPAQFARDIAAGIRVLAERPALRIAMGEAARRRVIEVGTWHQRMLQIDEVYARISRPSH